MLSPTEHERLELQSAAIDIMMLDKPFHAPLYNPKNILEVGSGTGTILRQLAALYPSASIISIDLSSVPNQDTFPANVKFFQGDFSTLAVTKSQLAAESFDYIFSRMLIYGMSDWPSYIAKARSLLAPGGYIELQELDTSIFLDSKQSPLPRSPWMTEMYSVFASRGLDVAVGQKLGGYLCDAGFVDVEVKEFRWMYGTWDGHPETDLIAKVSNEYNGKVNFGAYKRALGSQKTEEEIKVVEEDMLRDFGEQEGKHMRFRVVVGRKPQG